MTAPLVVTCGEPAGIGPEIAAAAWHSLKGEINFAWIGDPAHLPSGTPITVIDDLRQCSSAEGLPVLPHRFATPRVPGTPQPSHAQAVIDVIARGVRLVRNGDGAALCTAPIHKKALMDGAQFTYPGHTEYLEALCDAPRAVMMLASDKLRVVPVTIHIPLAEVPKALTPALLRDTIRITHEGLRSRFGIARPRLAVAGLNPHAGEGGAIGREELDFITDIVAEAAADGYDITGPLPADTMFHAAARARYDAALAMYHDQALIPIKTLDFDSGVNVTLGLPIIRTSPDHGTALDIAGRGEANPTSMIQALRLAAHMANA